MKDNKMVSIIMPVYNGGHYLRYAITDVLTQTYEDIELICIDDGSTDDSLRIMQYFEKQDSRVRVYNQINKGAGFSRNFGIEKASGKYVVFLDCDDRYKSNLIQTAVDRAEDEDLDILIYDGISFDDVRKAYLNEYALDKECKIPNKVFNYKELSENEIFKFSASCVWNKLYKRDFINKNNLRFMNTPYLNDVYFSLISIIKAKRIQVIDDVLLYYRKGNSQSISGEKYNKYFPECPIEVLLQLRKTLEEMGVFNLIAKSYIRYSYEIMLGQINKCITYKNYDRSALKIEEVKKELFALDYEGDIDESDMLNDLMLLKEKDTHSLIIQVISRTSRYKSWEIEQLRFDLMEKENSMPWFEMYRIPKDSRVVLYGAGERGKEIWKLNQKKELFQIVLWVDSKVKELQEFDIHISGPEQIDNQKCDYVIIAVDNIKVMDEIRGLLMQKVPIEKIKW